MNNAQRIIPWAVVLLCLAYLGAGFVGGRETGPMDWAAFARIPVSAEGRTKPLDSFARNSMMVMSGRQTVTTAQGQRPAIEWLADALARPEAAADRPVFRIDHPDVITLLGLSGPERHRFSFRELSPKLDEISRQAESAQETPAKRQDPFQRQILDLHRRLFLYMEIRHMESPYTIAPLAAGQEWRPMASMIAEPALESHPTVVAFRTMLTAYSKGDAAGFSEQARAYLALVGDRLPEETRRAGYEVVFNRYEPFYRASALYVVAFLLASVGFLLSCLSRGEWAGSLGRATVGVLCVALLLHTIGIASRIYLQGRPPVTNLYSSAVFIGWVCVVLGLTIEWFFRLGLGSIAASAIGFATLVVAHNLSNTGDTMEMMQAVLDTNFWLATHVVVVTIGYSATFLAGFLGITYIALGVFTPLLRTDLGKSLPKMIYGVICFAALASFVGTVLGGIWADQSWGRFWGWDPKENGAALIVLMNVLTLHARWGGMVRDRGVAVLAVCGNIITAWSWFGTNMLGIGLHSYGFMASAVFWLIAFIAVQLIVIAIGLIPHRMWRSAREGRTPPAPARGARGIAVATERESGGTGLGRRRGGRPGAGAFRVRG
jgi:ABC-type transport system involved in cytochrome c biogenesis permease subunit